MDKMHRVLVLYLLFYNKTQWLPKFCLNKILPTWPHGPSSDDLPVGIPCDIDRPQLGTASLTALLRV